MVACFEELVSIMRFYELNSEDRWHHTTYAPTKFRLIGKNRKAKVGIGSRSMER